MPSEVKTKKQKKKKLVFPGPIAKISGGAFPEYKQRKKTQPVGGVEMSGFKAQVNNPGEIKRPKNNRVEYPVGVVPLNVSRNNF